MAADNKGSRRPARSVIRDFARAYVVGQFRRPSGFGGRLAGWVMAHRPSNKARTDWTIDLLNIAPGDNVLEVGYGPGLGLSKAAGLATRGLVVGIDHSASMRRIAGRRNRNALRGNRLRLLDGRLEELEQALDSYWDSFFENIFGVNVLMFCDDPQKALVALTKKLAPGGKIAITFQPRVGDTSESAALREAARIGCCLEAANLGGLRVERLDRITPTAICVIGQKPPH